MFFKARFELAPYGEEFNKSYIVLKLQDRNQILKYTQKVAAASKALESIDENDIEGAVSKSSAVCTIIYQQVKERFVEGEVFEGEAERPMKKTDIDSFPPALVKELTQFIQGALEKKT